MIVKRNVQIFALISIIALSEPACAHSGHGEIGLFHHIEANPWLVGIGFVVLLIGLVRLFMSRSKDGLL